MNTFGRLFRISIFGESHGKSVGVLLDGVPAGLPLTPDDFRADLARRRPGAKGTTPRREDDIGLLKSGVFRGRTAGAPLLIQFENKDQDSAAYDAIRNTPRPGHADLTTYHKYGGYNDYQGSGHFSGRITLGLVAAGVVAKKLLAPIAVTAALLQVGGRTEFEPVIEQALAEEDSVGALIECHATNVPVGLGEPFFDSVESVLSHLVFAIPGIRGIEFGSGFAAAAMRGSECNDPILDADGATATNHAGGVNGGITNGNDLVFRAAVKPTSSIGRRQRTVNLRTGEAATLVVSGRHDACFALRLPVVLEAVTAIGLADLLLLEQRVPRVMR